MNILAIILTVMGLIGTFIVFCALCGNTYHNDAREKTQSIRAFSALFTLTSFVFICTFWVTFVYQPKIYTDQSNIYTELSRVQTSTEQLIKYKTVCRVKVWTTTPLTAGLDVEFIKTFDNTCESLKPDVESWITDTVASFN